MIQRLRNFFDRSPIESASLICCRLKQFKGFGESDDKVAKRSGHRLSMILRFRLGGNRGRGGLQLGLPEFAVDEAHIMNKIILADSQAIFRAGTAKVLAMDEDVRIIAQCTDLDRMHHAITTFPGSIVLFAASLQPDLVRLRSLLESVGSRGIVIAENNDGAGSYIQQGPGFRCLLN